jgi:hypothetical protein
MGRNARFASLGNLAGAAVLGAIGILSQRSVFLLTAVMALPTLLALRAASAEEDHLHPDAQGCLPEDQEERALPWELLKDRRLLVFAGCIFLFYLSNAAIIPVAVSNPASSALPTALVTAGFVILPQLVVASLALVVGRAS